MESVDSDRERINSLSVSSIYVCPVRGLASLEAPDPGRLGQAAKVAAHLGLSRLLLPVMEEALLRPTGAKVGYLDGIIRALDQMGDAGMNGRLIAPAQHILGLDWVAPYLAGGFRDPRADRVFVDGKLRRLRPYDWWVDPSVIRRRVSLFRELVGAVHGHPALTGWLVMDRALEWPRPGMGAAGLLLQSLLGEIRERDEDIDVVLGMGWGELLEPELVLSLVGEVSGLRLSWVPSPGGCSTLPLKWKWAGADLRNREMSMR
ncbi:MAG: hypothetical protein JRJ85_04890 [Deltaproteobacteria bacterium]|nr:hypothetical protein [Deltaproteobacteria bacterium]